MDPAALWTFLPIGYTFSILVETPILLIGLSREHPLTRRLFAGLWLTACTYPIVTLVLPLCIPSRIAYLLVAETFAPVAECALFWAAFGSRDRLSRAAMWRDFAVIITANLASFGLGEVYFANG